jgi:hypothetical protein
MTTNNKQTNVIGVTGFARAGKDTFVKVASKILKKNGYTTSTLSFARGLKDDLEPWLIEKYGISAWTEDAVEKQLVRPFMVAHGCGKRIQTEGRYWIDKVDEQIRNGITACKDVDEKHVFFISDVRFPNEEKWLHENYQGWLVHLRKYSMVVSKGNPVYNEIGQLENPPWKHYDSAPNEEEAKNDPLVMEKADFKLELEEVIGREKAKGNIITVDDLVDCSYLNEEIMLCLLKCPFLTLTTQK